jgi:CBS domain-containing protein
MKVRELLEERRVIVPLGAKRVRDATRQLAKVLIDTGAVSDPARFRELLKSEWPEDIVAVAGRAFLPHFRTDAVKHLAVALGVAPEPVSGLEGAGAGARVVILIVAPTDEASAYLRAMAALASALSSDEVLEGLHGAKSAPDILALPSLGETPVPAEVTVRDVMTVSVMAVPQDLPLPEAAEQMLRRDVAAAPVIGPAGEVVGVLTDRHLLQYLLPHTVQELSTGQVRATKRRAGRGAAADPSLLRVRDVMDRSVLCLAEEQTIADVAALMLSKSVDRFPVTRDGALVGFLTRGDIVRKLLSAGAALPRP